MKIWKKINKGFLLTIIVLIGLIIYLVGVENQRKADKDDIKQACETFIEFTDKYLVLPEDTQIKAEKEKRKNEIKSEIKKLMIDNEEASKIQAEYLISAFESENSENRIKTKNKRTITKISSYEFDGNQVTVQFDSKVDVTYKNINLMTNEEDEEQTSFNTTYDEIMLQKVEGQWKVIYSNIQYNDYGSSYTYTDQIVF